MKFKTVWSASFAALLLGIAPIEVCAQAVTRLLVSPIQLRLETGSAGQITVEAQDALSRAITAERAQLQFSSADTTVAKVNPEGAVLALRAGRTEIIVRAGNVVRSVVIVVSGGSGGGLLPPVPAVPSVAPRASPMTSAAPVPAAPSGQTPVGATIQPISIQLLPGERFSPSFRLVYADGTQTEARDVVWNTFGAAIALDPNSNEVIGVVPGSGTLGGRFGSAITSSVPVTVGEAILLPDPDSVQLVSGALDTVSLLAPGQGRRRVTQNLTWRTTDPSILRVLSPTAGIVQALDAGEATLIVDGYGVTRAIPVRVTPRVTRLATIPAQGTTVEVGTGGNVTLEARAYGTAGTVLSTSTLTWRVADTTIARIDARGAVSGVRAGTTRVTLDAAGLETISWPLTVQVSRVTFAAAVTSITAGSSQTLVVKLRGPDQRDFGTVTSARFTSSTPAVATVDASGTVSGVAPGRATISVALPGAGADSVTVYVTGRALISGTIAGVRGLWQLVHVGDTVPRLLMQIDTGSVSQAVWSPDRTTIALTFEPLDRTNLPRVALVDADGRNWRNLSPDTISASDPSWMKDGTAVLMAGRDPKVSSVLRVAVGTRTATVLASGSSMKFRYPVTEPDTSGILVRVETGGQVDVARVKAGAVVTLTSGKPREELLTQLRDGRLLLAVDSSSRSRPSTLQWVTVGPERVQTPTPVRLPPGLIVADISAGYDDGTVLIVARARSWPGSSGAVLVVLQVALDGSDPKVLLVLNEKDAVTVRTD